MNKSDALTLKIHADFDSAEDRILAECQRILSEAQVPTETQVERKADKLRALGFVNSETVAVAETLKKRRAEAEREIRLVKSEADLITELKMHYPLDKFVTLKELERICEKYNLIYAPVSKYAKDVPEKNVIEMERVLTERGSLKKEFAAEKIIRLHGIEDDTLLKAIGHPDGVFTQQEIIDLTIMYYGSDHSPWTNNAAERTWLYVVGKKVLREDLTWDMRAYNSVTIEHRSELHIAAPATHFCDLKGLKKKGFGFLDFRTVEVKDPIVFQFCKGDICRIVTKWGTSDDQSYLDPGVLNEIMN